MRRRCRGRTFVVIDLAVLAAEAIWAVTEVVEDLVFAARTVLAVRPIGERVLRVILGEGRRSALILINLTLLALIAVEAVAHVVEDQVLAR
jgi:predicted PurR-regulated permease PerM